MYLISQTIFSGDSKSCNCISKKNLEKEKRISKIREKVIYLCKAFLPEFQLNIALNLNLRKYR